MHVGVSSSGVVVSCLGGDGGRTPPKMVNFKFFDFEKGETSIKHTINPK